MTFISLLILIVSVVAHEVAHGVAALWQGDTTAKYANRLTLNPIPHIDWMGSIILPGLLALSGSPIVFGWAKPVPINPYNFRNQRWGEAMVAAAGPLVNIIIATVFTLLLKLVPLSEALQVLAITVIIINIVLAFFNLIPIPPLDGSKILFSFVPQRFHRFKNWMDRQGFIIGLLIVVFIWQSASPLVAKLIGWLIG